MESILSDAYKLKLENFEGPFDLLFHLIEKNEMDLYDVQISEITDQYLEYLFAMQQMNLDIASEFLVMASTLLHIKSRMLLPKKVDEDEEEIDPREELVLKLIEYKKYKKAAHYIKNKGLEASKLFYGHVSHEDFGETEKTYTLAPSTLKEMYSVLVNRNIMKKNHKLKYMNKILKHEKYTVGRKIRMVARILFTEGKVSFFKKFKKNSPHKLDTIVGFLSILELAKEKKAILRQKEVFKDIEIEKTDKLNAKDYEEYIDIYN